MAVPRPAPGSAVDPIALEPVDEVVITTLVDNVFDGLLTDDEHTTRAPLSSGLAEAPQFETGLTAVGMMAEHGFSALVSVRRGASTTTLLFDTGLSPDAMVTNASRLGTDLSQIQAVVLSHGHFDHAGGLAGLAGKQGTRSLPMVVHPMIWTRRRLAVPGREPTELPTLSKRALEGEGFAVIERREPSLLVDGCVLITGEVDRTTEFEHDMPAAHQFGEHALRQHRVGKIEPRELVLMRMGRHRQVLQEPIVQRPMVLEFQRAQRMGYALDGVRLSMGEIVARIDFPSRAGAGMDRMQNPIKHGIAQVDIARAHVLR